MSDKKGISTRKFLGLVLFALAGLATLLYALYREYQKAKE
jgi:hypothetical protein